MDEENSPWFKNTHLVHTADECRYFGKTKNTSKSRKFEEFKVLNSRTAQRDLQIDIDFTDLIQDFKQSYEKTPGKCENCEVFCQTLTDVINSLEKFLNEKENKIDQLRK